MKKMQLGQIVDFCAEYNKREKAAAKEAEKRQKGKGKRKATQSDIDSFFG